jgi:two-component system, cell cycle sensor histidine kinase and response regulator CckA
VTETRRFMFGILLAFLFLPVYPISSYTAEVHPQSIKVVMDDNYPPFCFRDSTGKQQGVMVDQWRLWEQTTGIKVEISSMDWDKAISSMKAGEYDVIDTIFKTEERSGWLDFTRPYDKIEVPIFFDREISGITSVASLNGFTVAVKSGDAAIDILKSNGVTSLQFFNSYKDIIQAARDRKVRVFVADKPPVLYFLNKYGLIDQFKISTVINIGELHRAVRKGNVELLTLVQAGFDRIPQDKLKKIETKWYGSPVLNYRSRLYLFFVAGGLFLLMLLLFIWNRVLRTMVNNKTAALNKLSQAVEQSPASIAITDLCGNIEYVNPAFCIMTGYSADELLGQNPRVLKTDTTSIEEYRNLWNTITQGRTWQGVFCNKKKSGELYWESARIAPVKDNKGIVKHYVAIKEDITERKRAEEALRQSEENYKKLAHEQEIILTASPVGICFLKEQNIVWSNPTFQDMFGYETGAASNINATQFCSGSELFAAMGEEKYSVIIDGAIYSHDIMMKRNDGSLMWCNLVGHAIRAGHLEEGSIWILQDISERKRAEAALLESKKQLRFALEGTNDGLWDIQMQTGKVYLSPRGCEILGYEADEIEWGFKVWSDLVHSDDLGVTKERLRAHIKGKSANFSFEHRLRTKSGDWKWVYTRGKVVEHDQYGTPLRVTGTFSDITGQKKLELQLVQAQKMESVGRLAGGIAHDFNNMLTIILGNSQLGIMKSDPASPIFGYFEAINKAADRSSDLTKQLLAFARKQTIAPKVLDLNDVIASMIKMLLRLIGEDISLNWKPASCLWPVKVDESQINQIMANLCVNARDAIANIGTITIETKNCSVDEHHSGHHIGIVPGEYVQLTVSDDGCGMNKETLDHIYEPFFTTKNSGEGTGLGLSTVYGIVKQNDGFISVYSEVGLGTVFTIYLPRIAGTVVKEAQANCLTEPMPHGQETILLVEDEQSTLDMIGKVLADLGYNVLKANTPGLAIHLAREYTGEIHLLITDIIMPEMNGRDLSNDLISRHPRLKLLFMSGYTANVIEHHRVLDENEHFIQKPFSLFGIATKIREVLDAK